MYRPSDHIDSTNLGSQSRRGVRSWLLWFWRQLSSMRTALFLLLLLALAAIPGSLVPQRSADPNGVSQYFRDNPQLAPAYDAVQLFDVYRSVWFSSIYLLLFVSLIGCVIPRTKHHWKALRSAPPRTPTNLSRLVGFQQRTLAVHIPGSAETVREVARKILRRSGYRVAVFVGEESTSTVSVSAERGYLRETGNLVFHLALVGILVAVGFGSGFGFSGQRVVVQGEQVFVNTLSAYDSFTPGRFFQPESLVPYSLKLDQFSATYESKAEGAFGQPLDYTAWVTTQQRGEKSAQQQIKVNAPLRMGESDIYLLGNGYAPTITVRDATGKVIFTDSVPFLPQDANLTSVGVVKVPDGLPEQIGMVGFFYPTQAVAPSGAFYSAYPDSQYPVLTLNIYQGDLGINSGIPSSVYSLNTDKMVQLTGGKTGVDSLELKPGETSQLPYGLGSITFDDVRRFVSLDIHYDPTQGLVLFFTIFAVLGLLSSLFIPRRRMWVTISNNSEQEFTLEYAGLARGEDPRLVSAVAAFADRHITELNEHSSKNQERLG